jgi:succinate dehydrogenase / fumarate reductase membrane anchor subunit
MTDFTTPLSRVRGHGAANEGLRHHIATRVSAIVMALVLPFFLWGLMKALPGGYDGLIAWIGSASGAFIVIVFITAGLYHGRLGTNEVILDYGTTHASRSFFLLLNTFACFGLWLVGIMAILKIWLGA